MYECAVVCLNRGKFPGILLLVYKLDSCRLCIQNFNEEIFEGAILITSVDSYLKRCGWPDDIFRMFTTKQVEECEQREEAGCQIGSR